MGHGHSHLSPQKALHWTTLVTALFCIVEFIAGWWANSLALMGDAVHYLTDLVAMGVAYFTLWLGRKPPSPRMTYGYQRAEVLGALASGLAMWLLCGILILEAVKRLIHPQEVEGPVVAWVALLALLSNAINLMILHRPKRGQIALKGVYLHVWSDLLTNGATLVAGIIIALTAWHAIDPLITLLIAGLILYGSWDIVKETLHILMEGVPKHMDVRAIYQSLSSLPSVEGVHHLHVWEVTQGRVACSVHVIAPEGVDVLEPASRLLKEKFGIVHATIQIERTPCT